jgi:hypothetical protein
VAFAEKGHAKFFAERIIAQLPLLQSSADRQRSLDMIC